MNKKIFLSAILIPAVAGVFLAAYLAATARYDLFPAVPHAQIKFFTDSDESGGASRFVNVDTAGKYLSYDFIVGSTIEYPFAGVEFSARSGKYFDLSTFDHLELSTDGAMLPSLSLYLKTDEAGVTRPDNELSTRYSLILLVPQLGKKKYDLPLRDFTTPVWWYDLNGLSPGSVALRPDLQRVSFVTIESSELTERNKRHRVTVTRLCAVRDRAMSYAIIGGVLLLWYGLIAGMSLLRGRRSRPSAVPYTPIDMGNHADEQTKRIIDVIGRRFSEPELSVGQVAKDAGVSVDKISVLLTAWCGLSFKQYLIGVRLTEAKRLLLETDRQVTEIALAVGFNWPTTFNRLFREREGMAPSGFRKKKR